MSGNVKASKPAGSGKPAGKSAMGWGGAAPPRNVHVDVFATTNTKDGFVEFSHRWRFEDEHLPPPLDPTGLIDLPAGKFAYQLHFHLRDETDPRKGLSFIAPSSDAMWVAADGRCPTVAGNGAGQILFRHPDNPHHLTVDDLNSNVPAMVFKYALRFNGEKGEQAGDPPKQCPPYEYDPDFKNGGGNT